MRNTSRNFVAVLTALVLVTGARAASKPGELKKVHVLLVIDDTDADLAPGVRTDMDMIGTLFVAGVPRDRFSLKVLRGKDATRDNVLDYYRNLQAGPDEGVVFYYSGRGATFKEGHALELGPDKEKLKRSLLIGAMRQNNAGLTVILTECCANRALDDRRGEPRAIARDTKEPTEIAPLLRNLFFEARGIVDVTASTLDSALTSPRGSVFTSNLFELLQKEPKFFRPADPDFVRWAELFKQVRDQTSEEVAEYVRLMKADGKMPRAEKQVPCAFQLPDGGKVDRPRWRFGVHVEKISGRMEVRRVFPGTPAARIGLAAGDIVTAIDGAAINSNEDFEKAVDKSDGRIKIEIYRPSTGQSLSGEVKLDRMP